MKRTHYVLIGLGVLSLAIAGRAAAGFRPTEHATEPSPLGTASSEEALEAVVDQPGPITVETVIGADWEVPLSGLVNLNNPKAAALKDHDEPIIVAFHAIRHPTRGLFLIDTGIERAIRDDFKHSAVGSGAVVSRVMHVEKMKVRTDTATWLSQQHDAPAGVFLTHLHLDHVSGMRDVPSGTPVYVGPGEAQEKTALNYFVTGVTDAALEGKGTLREWQFKSDGVLDVFGDGSFFAIWVPGHTAGSTAFVARTPSGPVLFTGDACHTAWGWKNGVEPGSFSEDRPKSQESLARLEKLVERHPRIDVRPGHQLLGKSE